MEGWHGICLLPEKQRVGVIIVEVARTLEYTGKKFREKEEKYAALREEHHGQGRIEIRQTTFRLPA
eukprot:570386-Hanusia_phi.AAC.1